TQPVHPSGSSQAVSVRCQSLLAPLFHPLDGDGGNYCTAGFWCRPTMLPLGSLKNADQPTSGLISILGTTTVPPSSATFARLASMSSTFTWLTVCGVPCGQFSRKPPPGPLSGNQTS